MTPGKQAILNAPDTLASLMSKEGIWPSTSPSNAALPQMEITPAARLYLEGRSTCIIKQIAAIDGLVQTERAEQGIAQ